MIQTDRTDHHWITEYLSSPERKEYESRFYALHGRFPCVPVPFMQFDECVTMTKEEFYRFAEERKPGPKPGGKREE